MQDDDLPPDGHTTLFEALKWLQTRIHKGVDCPLCGQFAKVYCRNLTSSEALGLIIMYRFHGTGWGHAPSTPGVARLGGALARLRFWGLLEESLGVREDGGRAGFWRVTPLGEAFVNNQAKVQQVVLLFDGQYLGQEGDWVSIVDVLGTKYNYQDMMSRTPEELVWPSLPLDDSEDPEPETPEADD